MAVGERPTQKPQRRKTASFSSSLLDAIYHSLDEPRDEEEEEELRRNNAAHVEDEVQSLRRAIMVEKWIQNYSHFSKSNHNSSNSGSSSETDSSSASRPKCEGRFTRSKSKAIKIYEDLKKVKEPISPGAKIANFLNSIFSPRNLKKNNGVLEEWRKSRSMKEDKTTTTRSCLSKNPTNSSRGNKSKRSVRFCPAVSVIVDEDHSHHHLVGSQFIKKNIDSFDHEFRREFYESEKDVDDKSCASSDLFELENIGRRYEEELPVFGTTTFKINQSIATVNLYDY